MKNKRQEMILKLIKEDIYDTQDDLQEKLNELGFNATQSTVSRDIKQLRIVKALDPMGNYRYMVPAQHSDAIHTHTGEQYINLFEHSVISVDYAFNDVVIKCYPGMASSACVSIDKLFSDKIMGSLAGEDTILVITKSVENAEELCKSLKNLCKG